MTASAQSSWDATSWSPATLDLRKQRDLMESPLVGAAADSLS